MLTVAPQPRCAPGSRDPLESRSLALERDVSEATVSLHLKHDRSANRHALDGVTQRRWRRNRRAVHRPDDIAALERDVRRPPRLDSGRDDDTRFSRSIVGWQCIFRRLSRGSKDAQRFDERGPDIEKGLAIALVRRLDGSRRKRLRVVPTLRLDLDRLTHAQAVESNIQLRQRELHDRRPVDRRDDIAGTQARVVRRTARCDVCRDQSGAGRQPEAAGHQGGDGLHCQTDQATMQMTVVPELRKGEGDQSAWQSEPETFAAAGQSLDESVDPDDVP